jgi:probable HAF family extracellular repeat protein
MNLRDWLTASVRPVRPLRRRKQQHQIYRQRLNVEWLEQRCLLTAYSITDLGTLGGTLSHARAINDRGMVVGGSELACDCKGHPFLWWGGMMHDIDPPGGGSSSDDAYGINNLGQVVGDAFGHPFIFSRGVGMTDLGFAGFAYKVNSKSEVIGQSSVPPHAFVWTNGSSIDLGTLGGNGVSSAYGINNQGEVVGQATGLNFFHAFVWTRSGGMRDLGTLDGNTTSTSGASAVNDLGQVVGSSYSQALGTTHAVYFSDHGVLDLGTLGGLSSAHALNNLGQVVGDSYTAFGDHAFITDLQGGPIIDLNALIPPDSGWDHLFTADGINDAGQIVGTGQMPGYDIMHAYLLSPVERPAPAVAPVPPVPGVACATASHAVVALMQSVGSRLVAPSAEDGDVRLLTSAPNSAPASASVYSPQAWVVPSAEGWDDPLANILVP